MKRAPKKTQTKTTELKLTELAKAQGGGKVIRDGKLTDGEYFSSQVD